MATTASAAPKLRRAAILAVGSMTWKLQKMTRTYQTMLEREMNLTRVMLATESNKVVQAELTEIKQSLDGRLSQTGTLTTALIQEVATVSYFPCLSYYTLNQEHLAVRASV